MTWSTVLSGLATLLASLTGLYQVTSQGLPEQYTDPTLKGRLKYQVISFKRIGDCDWRNEIRTVTPEVGPSYEVVDVLVCYQLLFTVQITFEGFDQSDDNAACHYLSLIERRLSWPSALATLSGLGLVPQDTSPFRSLPLPVGSRAFSRGTLDIGFLIAVNEIDAAGAGGGLVEHIEIASHYLFDVNGLPYPTQRTLTVDAPPPGD